MVSVAPSISGRIHLYVVPREPLELDQAAELHAVLETFLEALRLRMLPGKLVGVHALDRGEDGRIDACLDVEALDLGALRVLCGMLTYFAEMVAPLGTMMAWSASMASAPNLLGTDAPVPEVRDQRPFETTFTRSGRGAAPALVVEVVFGRALTDGEKDRLDTEIRVWAALVQGGYPAPGDLPGSSAIGPLTVRFDDPQTLRLHAEALLAGDTCFEPLAALVTEWSRSLPVVRLETA